MTLSLHQIKRVPFPLFHEFDLNQTKVLKTFYVSLIASLATSLRLCLQEGYFAAIFFGTRNLPLGHHSLGPFLF